MIVTCSTAEERDLVAGHLAFAGDKPVNVAPYGDLPADTIVVSPVKVRGGTAWQDQHGRIHGERQIACWLGL